MLHDFFAAAEQWMKGEVPPASLRRLGATPASDADLAFYPWLIRHGHHDVLASVYPGVVALVEAHGGPSFASLVDGFLRAHPPTGYVLQATGEGFGTWLEGALAEETFLDHVFGPGRTAEVVASLADYQYIQALSRHATDGAGFCLDERVFVRRYPVGVVALARDPHARATGATTVVVYRDLRDDVVRVLTPTVPTMAVFAALLGQPRHGALAIPAEALHAEHARLMGFGVYPVGTPLREELRSS